MKGQSGITLVALIITIIVLLILAMVSISLVMNSGIITRANHAVNNYAASEDDEQKQINNAEAWMNNYMQLPASTTNP